MVRKLLLVGGCLLFVVFAVHAQENNKTNTVDVGKNTQEVVENSNQLQPEALKAKSDKIEACGLAELFCLFTPKAKFVQEKTVSEALLPADTEEKNFFQKFSEFFSRIWGYSSDEKAGYINAGTPNERLKDNILGTGEFGIDTRNSTEFAHTNYLESMLPAALQKDVKYNEAQEPEVPSSETSKSTSSSEKGSKTLLSKLSYFSQKDPAWASVSGKKVCEYKDDGRPIYETIGNSGCGPTSVAMIVSGYKDASVTPVDTWEIMTKRGQTQCATGMGANQSLLEEYGLKTGGQWEGCGTSNPRICEQQMRKYLEVPGSERVLMVLAFLKKDDKGQCSWGGHYFNIAGFDEDGEPLIYDPYYGTEGAAPQRRSELNYQCVNYLNFLVVETK